MGCTKSHCSEVFTKRLDMTRKFSVSSNNSACSSCKCSHLLVWFLGVHIPNLPKTVHNKQRITLQISICFMTWHQQRNGIQPRAKLQHTGQERTAVALLVVVLMNPISHPTCSSVFRDTHCQCRNSAAARGCDRHGCVCEEFWERILFLIAGEGTCSNICALEGGQGGGVHPRAKLIWREEFCRHHDPRNTAQDDAPLRHLCDASNLYQPREDDMHCCSDINRESQTETATDKAETQPGPRTCRDKREGSKLLLGELNSPLQRIFDVAQYKLVLFCLLPQLTQMGVVKAKHRPSIQPHSSDFMFFEPCF
jgi:hypothetical protein